MVVIRQGYLVVQEVLAVREELEELEDGEEMVDMVELVEQAGKAGLEERVDGEALVDLAELEGLAELVDGELELEELVLELEEREALVLGLPAAAPAWPNPPTMDQRVTRPLPFLLRALPLQSSCLCLQSCSFERKINWTALEAPLLLI
jgi:hypothetical protein